jgi:hypothetical protein
MISKIILQNSALKLGEVVQLISSKWKNTKTIVSLTTPRKFLAQENVIIYDNANMWHSNIP